MWQLVNVVFNVIGVFLLLRFLWSKWLDYKAFGGESDFWTFNRHKYVISVTSLLLVATLILEFIVPVESWFEVSGIRPSLNTYIGVLMAFFISLIWMVYLRKLDIFDPESWKNIFLVFLAGCITVWLVFPISDQLEHFGFFLNADPLNDFLYCVVGIGMVEELVKLIPLLIIVRFKKIVREPYDFLLYASVAALGFAFVENSLYILQSNFYSINGRALMASVAHMTFSSVIGYGVMISMYKRSNTSWLYGVGGFLLASLMHGFYDFWLINPTAKLYNGLSLLFFLLTTHFWFTMKNKTINASRFYDPHRKLINDKLRYFLIFWLTALMAVSAILIGVFHGREVAHNFLRGQLLAFGFLLFYLSYSFSRFQIAPKLLGAGQRAFDAVIPNEPQSDHWGSE